VYQTPQSTLKARLASLIEESLELSLSR